MTGNVPNCLWPDLIEWWQIKGYNYVAGYCQLVCERNADVKECPFLASLAQLEEADSIVATKALARRPGFFSKFGNKHRSLAVLDEDPIGLLRPVVIITRDELKVYQETLDAIETRFRERNRTAALGQLQHSRRIATWSWQQIARQQPGGQPEAVRVPSTLRLTKAVLKKTSAMRKAGRKELQAAFHRLMRSAPDSTIRNVCRDLFDLASRAVARTVFATVDHLLFHVSVRIPDRMRVVVLDATANPELIRPLLTPRTLEVCGDERVQPAGRVVQFMDFNGPRSYLNKVPRKLVRIIDALGDMHAVGPIVLISHQSCVKALAEASRHKDRIKTAYFGALRGRNDLESQRGNLVACYIVAGSPKTTEEARRQIALAVYGRSILPFADLVTVRRGVLGVTPEELAEDEARTQVWEVRLKGYPDPRMQAVYEHTVTAELTHAADRARVLIHKQARVYLVTNEPCPKLWFAEKCLAGEFLDLSPAARADCEKAYRAYEAKARELLDAGGLVGNADVCRAFDRKNTWGHRYWSRFLKEFGDALVGDRKVRWKDA